MKLRYVDSAIVIYFLERADAFHTRATNWLAVFQAAGDELAVSDLSRLECRVGPLKRGDALLLAKYDGFFNLPEVHRLPLTTAVYDRATAIRASYNFKTADTLHLAAAFEHGCASFLTNDARLSRFTGLAVEVLP
jgi:predicted nucleic acid-binding protein